MSRNKWQWQGRNIEDMPEEHLSAMLGDKVVPEGLKNNVRKYLERRRELAAIMDSHGWVGIMKAVLSRWNGDWLTKGALTWLIASARDALPVTASGAVVHRVHQEWAGRLPKEWPSLGLASAKLYTVLAIGAVPHRTSYSELADASGLSRRAAINAMKDLGERHLAIFERLPRRRGIKWEIG